MISRLLARDTHPVAARWTVAVPALLCLTASAAAMPQQETADQDEAEQATESETEPEEDEEDTKRSTKSGYDTANRVSGPTSVLSDLQANDEWMYPLLTILGDTLKPFYRFKERISGTWGVAFAVDYNFLNQYASFSFYRRSSDKRCSEVLRHLECFPYPRTHGRPLGVSDREPAHHRHGDHSKGPRIRCRL